MPNSQNIIPDIATLVDAARSIVFTARRRDQLQDLTVKAVRTQVEHNFALPSGALDPDNIKVAIRKAVKEAVVGDLPADTHLGQDQEQGTLKKGSVASNLKKELAQEVKKEIPWSKTTSASKEEAAAKKKVTTKKEALLKKTGAQRQESKLEIVVASKAESSNTTEAADREAIPKVKRKSFSLDNVNEKPAKKSKQFKSRDIIDSDEDNDIDDKLVVRTLGRGSAIKEKEVEAKFKQKKRGDSDKSESEMSALIDDGPRKKKQKLQVANVKVAKDTKRKGATLSKKPKEEEEETIKRLKTLVSACGARKQWTRELADLPEPRQQIEHLKSVLTGLGMKGRYSIEKAKAIRRQRALSKELADVQEFERKAGVSRAQRRGQDPKKKTIGELDTECEESEESSENSDKEGSDASGGKNTASRKIKEYLAKQNDSD